VKATVGSNPTTSAKELHDPRSPPVCQRASNLSLCQRFTDDRPSRAAPSERPDGTRRAGSLCQALRGTGEVAGALAAPVPGGIPIFTLTPGGPPIRQLF